MLKILRNLFKGNKNDEKDTLIRQQAEMLKAMQEQLNSITAQQNRKENAQKKIEEQNKYSHQEDINFDRNLSVQYEIRSDKQQCKNTRTNEEEMIIEKAKLRDAIYSGFVDDIPEICKDFNTDVLLQYLLSLRVGAGDWSKEQDNLESYTREEIINAIQEISLENYKQAMINKGILNINVTPGQIAVLKGYGYADVDKIITSAKARSVIAFIENVDLNKPSDRQVELIKNKCEKLGIACEDYIPKDRKQASKMIDELKKMEVEKFGEEPVSEKQLELLETLMRNCELAETAIQKNLEDYKKNHTKNSISDVITDWKKKYDIEFPGATQGQKDFIISLCESLMTQAPANLNTLTREEAKSVIFTLKKKQLYMYSYYAQNGLTMKDIEMLTEKQVDNAIRKCRKDRADQYTL